ncbi:hypothetical protein ABFS83_03G119700 [Erythranthe nasuta]
MISSSRVAFSLVILSAAIAAFSKLLKNPPTKKKKPSLQCIVKEEPSSQCIVKKQPSSHCSVDNKDMISELPDDILILIISYMPLKCGIRTSILSNRWKNLYRYLSNVKLNCGDLLSRHLLEARSDHNSSLVFYSLNRFLKLRSGSEILFFRLSCCLSRHQFIDLISSFGGLGVRTLDLVCLSHCSINNCFFPFEFLSEIPSLRYFRLSSCILQQPTLESEFRFNSIQILSLSYVVLCDGAVEFILSNCLSLHSLRIVNCDCPSKLCFSGPGLRLKSLYIFGCGDLEEIEFYADNLVLFEFFNHVLVNFVFKHAPRLESVFLDVFNENVTPFVFGKLAKDLLNLKSLTFTKDHYFKGSIESMETDMFSKLRRLNLSLISGPRIDLFTLIPFLKNCPLLEEFILNINFLENEGPEEKKQAVGLHSELKKVEISGFVGTENEIEFALYILKSAVGLEKLVMSKCLSIYMGTINCRTRSENRWSEEKHEMISRRLRGQAISETAQVVTQYAAHFQDKWVVEDDVKVFL